MLAVFLALGWYLSDACITAGQYDLVTVTAPDWQAWIRHDQAPLCAGDTNYADYPYLFGGTNHLGTAYTHTLELLTDSTAGDCWPVRRDPSKGTELKRFWFSCTYPLIIACDYSSIGGCGDVAACWRSKHFAPCAPPSFSVVSVGKTSATLQWDGASGSSILRYEYSLLTDAWANVDVGVVTTATIPSLSAGTSYSVRVRAVNDVGGGVYSATLVFDTDPDAPGAVTSLAIVSASSVSITLRWGPPADAHGSAVTAFTIYGAPEGSPLAPLQTKGGTVFECTATDLDSETAYTFEVFAVNGVGTGDPSTITGATVAGSCDNDVMDGSESDVDCGGGCGVCGPGKTCVIPEDCSTSSCVGGVCQACSLANCKSCPEDVCVECSSSFILPGDTSACALECPPGEYDAGTPVCQACTTLGCSVCPGDMCTICEEDRILHAGTCLSACPQGYHGSVNENVECTACSTLSCDNCPADRCSLCSPGYILDLTKQCVGTCPPRTHGAIGTDNQCLACPTSCDYCPGGVCGRCVAGFILLNTSTCAPACPRGQSGVVDVDVMCTPITCTSPPAAPAGGAVSFSDGNAFSSVATFTCGLSSELVGSSTVTCSPSATAPWPSVSVVCREPDPGSVALVPGEDNDDDSGGGGAGLAVGIIAAVLCLVTVFVVAGVIAYRTQNKGTHTKRAYAGDDATVVVGKERGVGEELRELYEKSSPIASGGYGDVYKIMFKGEPVALKVVSKSTPQSEAEFHQEATIMTRLAALSSTHTVAMKVFSNTPMCIGLEYADQGSLMRVLQQTTPNLDFSLNAAAQACSAVAFIHDNGIVHLDLKPHQFMVFNDGRILLSDFGTSALLADGPVSGVVQGTPRYLAPERYRLAQESQEELAAMTSIKLQDPRPADMYSLGITLWSISTHATPFAHMDASTVPQMVVADPLFRPIFPAGDLAPEWYRDLAARCWADDPSARPVAADVAASLNSKVSANMDATVVISPTHESQLTSDISQLHSEATTQQHPSGSEADLRPGAP